jgi:predicted Zn-dependent protease
MLRQTSSTMRFDIAIVGLPRLAKKSLAGTRFIVVRDRVLKAGVHEFGHLGRFGRVFMNNPG